MEWQISVVLPEYMVKTKEPVRLVATGSRTPKALYRRVTRDDAIWKRGKPRFQPRSEEAKQKLAENGGKFVYFVEGK